MNTKTPSIMLLPQHNIRTFIIALFGLIVVTFSGAAFSEIRKATKKPVAAAPKEMQALTENYKTEILVKFYDEIKATQKDHEILMALSFESKELSYNCMAKRLTDVIWNSAPFRKTRSWEAVEQNGVVESNIEFCLLLSNSKDALNQQTQNNNNLEMTFNDLYLDYQQLKGKEVHVKGFMFATGDTGYMTSKQGGTTMLFVELIKLSRQERKEILEKCSGGCELTIEGIVNEVLYQKGITALSVH